VFTHIFFLPTILQRSDAPAIFADAPSFVHATPIFAANATAFAMTLVVEIDRREIIENIATLVFNHGLIVKTSGKYSNRHFRHRSRIMTARLN
jgi:hypothetical protein